MTTRDEVARRVAEKRRTIAMPLEATDQASLQSAIHANVEVGSTIFTDEAPGYIGLDGLFFNHQSVNHMAGEYTLGQASTNGIESVWAVLKRGVYGVYHQISKKHLDVVLAYRPKSKRKKPRKRKAAKRRK